MLCKSYSLVPEHSRSSVSDRYYYSYYFKIQPTIYYPSEWPQVFKLASLPGSLSNHTPWQQWKVLQIPGPWLILPVATPCGLVNGSMPLPKCTQPLCHCAGLAGSIPPAEPVIADGQPSLLSWLSRSQCPFPRASSRNNWLATLLGSETKKPCQFQATQSIATVVISSEWC